MKRFVIIILPLLCFSLACTTTKSEAFKNTYDTYANDSAHVTPISGPGEEPQPTPTFEPPSVSEKIKEDGKTGIYSQNRLTIETSPTNALVYIDNKQYGRSPLVVRDLAPGTYKIKVEKDGCEPFETYFSYRGGQATYAARLVRLTGFLNASVVPDNAELIYENEKIQSGLAKAPAGKGILSARLFGFVNHEEEVSIGIGETTSITIVLERAQFTVSELRLSNEWFDPNMEGPLGKTEISFYVSAPGSGTLIIKNEQGNIVLSRTFFSFNTWLQTVVWDGKNAEGAALPEGKYTVEVTCIEESGETKINRVSSLILNKSRLIRFQSVYCGVSGLLFCPTALTLPSNALQISTLAIAHTETINGELVARVPSVSSLRYGISNDIELDVQNGMVYTNYPALPFLLSLSLKYKFVDAGELLIFRGAAFARASYHFGTGSDTFSNFTGFSFGIPLNVRLGFVAIYACPEIAFSPWEVTGSSDYTSTPGLFEWLYLRSGILIGSEFLSLGASISFRTLPLSEGFVLDLPVLASAELYAMIPGTRFYASALASVELESLESYYLFFGLGIGYIFDTR